MFDLMKIILSFILTGFVGVVVSNYFQRKNSSNQLLIKKAERKAIELKEIRDKFEQLASERIFRARIMVSSLESNSLNEKDRDAYKEAVANWNKSLNTIFFDLKAQGLYSFSLKIEAQVHSNFHSSHAAIKRELEKRMPVPTQLDAALVSINRAYSSSSKITSQLTEIADRRWDDLKYADSVGLTPYNLESAGTLTLLIAIFHKSPLSLRISRSRIDR